MVKIKDVYQDAEKGIVLVKKQTGKFKKPIAKIPYVKVNKITTKVKLNLK
jgi:hypothetical protein